MLYFSIALVIISTEIMFTVLYMYRTFHPQGPNGMANEIEVETLKEKVQALEDQVSNIRVAQGRRRRDG